MMKCSELHEEKLYLQMFQPEVLNSVEKQIFYVLAWKIVMIAKNIEKMYIMCAVTSFKSLTWDTWSAEKRYKEYKLVLNRLIITRLMQPQPSQTLDVLPEGRKPNYNLI